MDEDEKEGEEPNGTNKTINWIENHFDIAIALLILLALIIFAAIAQ